MAQYAAMGGGVISAAGNIQQGQAQGQAARYNAEIETDNAEFARQAGEDRAKQLLRAGEITRSTIRARASASGLAADTGSPLLVQEEAIYESHLDALKTKYAAKVQGYGHKQRAMLYRMAGRQAVSAGFMNAGASLLTGASSGYAIEKLSKKTDKKQ